MKKLIALVLLGVPMLAKQWECKSDDKLTACSTTAVDDPAVVFIISGSGPNGRGVAIGLVREHVVINDDKTSSSFVWFSLDEVKPIRVPVLISNPVPLCLIPQRLNF